MDVYFSGMADYMDRYGKGIMDVSNDRAPIPSWNKEDSKELCSQLEEWLPTAKLQVKYFY